MANSAPTSDELSAALSTFVPEMLQVTGTPGLSIAVARNGDVIFDAGFGFADLAGRTPATARSIYRVGSFTKVYTAVSVLQLVEEGIVDLYGCVSDYLGELDLRNPLGEREITVYDLLTFRSGLADDAGDWDTRWPGSHAAYLAEALADFRRREYGTSASRWSAKVGARFQYSSLGFAILGHLVATTNPEGLSYPAYVHRHILEPLGMRSSYFATAEEEPARLRDLGPRLTIGYGRFGSTLVPTPILHASGVPTAGLCCSAGDHLRVLTALLQGGERHGVRLLSTATATMMVTPQTVVAGAVSESEEMCGLGILTRPGGADRYFGHLGAHPWGWYHGARAYPALRVAVVVLTNRFDVSRWDNPVDQIAPGIIFKFVASLFTGARRTATGARKSWPYKEGFMAGMLLAERTNGMLGVPSRLGASEAAELVARGQVVDTGTGIDQDWRDGFVAGVRDFGEVAISPESIRTRLRSDAMPVTSAEQCLVALRFGRRGAFPMPQRFFAAAAGDGPGAGSALIRQLILTPWCCLGAIGGRRKPRDAWRQIGTSAGTYSPCLRRWPARIVGRTLACLIEGLK